MAGLPSAWLRRPWLDAPGRDPLDGDGHGGSGEGLFATLAKPRIMRGVFHSIQELKYAIHSFITDTNAKPKPFIWTRDPDKIIAAVKRGATVYIQSTKHFLHAGSSPPSDTQLV